jgi:hypothetical protein
MRVRGFYEWGHVLHILDAETQGFGRADIESVESFWAFGDMHSSAAGFVLQLRDGRRPYIDFLHWHGFEQDEDFRIEVEFLPSGQAHPAPRPHDELPWPPGEWSSETVHLHRLLAATPTS